MPLGEGVALGVDDPFVVGDGVVVDDVVIKTFDDVEGVDVADDALGVGVAVAI